MPLSVQEKNQIAQGGTAVAQIAIAEGAGLGLLGTGLLGVAFLPLIAGLTAQQTRVRFPQLSPMDIGRAARAAGSGFSISSDPFFGDVVISRPEQAPFLAQLVRSSAERRFAATQDFSDLLVLRQGVIEGLEETAVERGFAREVDPALRGGVFRETEDAPLQFIEGNFLP